jgi:hypothetical protein
MNKLPWSSGIIIYGKIPIKFRENSQMKKSLSHISSLLSNVFFYCHVNNTLITFYNPLLGGKTYHNTQNLIKIFILI